MIARRLLFVVSLLAYVLGGHDVLASEDQGPLEGAYKVQPGDRLRVSVWGEQELQTELLVAPDGVIAIPLVGEISIVGKSIAILRQEITEKLKKYIADPLVTVTLSEVLGNRVYVLGQVNRPGQFVVNPAVDVMQALSMAGGATAYASLNNIIILRRTGTGQIAIPFKYGDVAAGRNLEQNIVLKSGDVVVVP